MEENSNGKNNSKSWRVEDLHSHLSRDKTAAKMGHPFDSGCLKKGNYNCNRNSNGDYNCNSNGNSNDYYNYNCNGNGGCKFRSDGWVGGCVREIRGRPGWGDGS